MLRIRHLLVASALAVTAVPALAQSTPATGLRVEPSGRATTQVIVSAPGAQGARPTPLTVRIDYGQPHARGRAVAGGLVPYDQVWRTGANSATTLTTEVDLEIGGTRVPKGTYTLYSLLGRNGWKLVINRQTGQWGTQYDAAKDLARVDMTLRQLATPAESFSLTLVPAADAPARGTLVMSWGTLHGSVPWRALPPNGAPTR